MLMVFRIYHIVSLFDSMFVGRMLCNPLLFNIVRIRFIGITTYIWKKRIIYPYQLLR